MPIHDEQFLYVNDSIIGRLHEVICAWTSDVGFSIEMRGVSIGGGNIFPFVDSAAHQIQIQSGIAGKALVMWGHVAGLGINDDAFVAMFDRVTGISDDGLLAHLLAGAPVPMAEQRAS